ncbi:MAG TPA: ABC transporter permease subunit [Thermoanaerobaculia bacterium]|nr:ABC transporter permease subunit [Thermoanaerobaculia bacterium]
MPKLAPATALESERAWPRLTELVVCCAMLALFYGVVVVAGTWLGPFTPAATISRRPSALPRYAAYSLLRLGIAYGLSLSFALVYGYLAAYRAKLERVLIPLLDILQSIPVLSFLPGVMLAMIALFPRRQLGVEMGAILLIFTGQVWNMAFSFYSSLKAIPRDLHETARLYRFTAWQRFTQLELPSAAIGLVWNSMMSVAGGWFFLMACEMFVLGARDFRLPGLGSYLQVAASAGDTRAILWGLAAMIGVILLLDQLVWRPVLAWADKFKMEQVESASRAESGVLDFLRRSPLLAALHARALAPLGERLTLFFARHAHPAAERRRPAAVKVWAGRAFGVLFLAAVAYGVAGAGLVMAKVSAAGMAAILRAAGATFLRVNAALLVGAAWTVPVGVAIGFSPRLSRVAQPLAQIAASVPATALFPVVLLLLTRVGGGMGIASIVLMLLGTQWYILFNVLAGAMAIPTDLKEAANVFGFSRRQRWRLLILPGIFPYLVTGLVTASGGAWNASVVAEYFHFKDRILATTGLGATISKATDTGNFDQLLVATLVMAAVVVTINRLVWRRLYRLAETRYKLEG